MAGIPLKTLRELVAPVHTMARVIPLPSVAIRRGITPLYPAIEPARGLFNRLGRVIDVADESSFELFSAATATIAAHFVYLGRISAWLAVQGIEQQAAQEYVGTMFGELAASLHGNDLDFGKLMREHATPGGINELFCQVVSGEGMWETVDAGFDRVRQRLMHRTGDS